MNKNTKLMVGVGIGCLVLILLVSFTLAYSGRDITLLNERSLNLSVNGQELIIPLEEDQAVYDLPSLTTETANIFILENDAGANIKVDGTTLQTGKKAKVNVSKLDADYRLTVTVQTSKDNRTIYFRTLSSQLPTMEASGQSLAGGEYCVCDAEKPVMYKLNDQGQITWYLALSQEAAQGKIFTDFQQHTLENGEIRYSYQMVDPEVQTYGMTDYFPGKRIVMNEKFEIVENDAGGITLLDKDGENDAKVPGDAVDGHGFVMISDKDYITEAVTVERVTNVPATLSPNTDGTRVAAAVIQEVKDGKVSFQWKSTDCADAATLYALSAAGNDYASGEVQDYLHINALLLDPKDNNLIVSFKNANAIVKINREDGKIMWILGGTKDSFGLSEDQKMTAQTSVTLSDDGSLVILDSSRILKVSLDETAKKVSTFKEYALGDQAVTKYGSAQLISGDADAYAMAWGVGESGKAALTERNLTDNKKGLEVLYPNGEDTFRANHYPAKTK